MHKMLKTTLAVSGLFAISMPLTQAADISNDFTVSVTLSSQCEAKDSATKTLAFGTYTAFQDTALNATGINIEFQCTRGLAPTSVAFDTANGTAAGGGVIAGLNYDMEFAAAVVTDGDEATSAVGEIGTADVRSYAISGTMAAEQAGTDGATASHTRTLIVTY
jgi:hypothetical protein